MRSKCVYRIIALLNILLPLSGCTSHNAAQTLQDTVGEVDLQRYMGKWYEIASFPNWFQKGCFCSAAEYSLRMGFVEVRNSCRGKSPDGAADVAIGKAFIVPGSGNSKLKVQFQWPFMGDYWIIALDDNYRYAMVGHPKRNYLWILSRTKHMDNATFEQLQEIARSKGYDTDKLQKTEQSCGN
ncbi:MAG: lipocalin family protein [Syntrophobacteraceae bacterium]